MKRLTAALLLTVAVMISACSIDLFPSREQRAQNHLGKAIRLDPSILKGYDSARISDSTVLRDSVLLRDSVRYTTRDSIVLIPSTYTEGEQEVGKPFRISAGAGPNRILIWSDGTHIYWKTTSDSLVSRSRELEREVASYKEKVKELEHKKSETVKIREVVTVTKKTIPWWAKPALWISLASLTFLFLWLFLKLGGRATLARFLSR